MLSVRLAEDPEAVAGVGPGLLPGLEVLPAPPDAARAVVVVVVVRRSETRRRAPVYIHR